jgi:hypothetical protein
MEVKVGDKVNVLMEVVQESATEQYSTYERGVVVSVNGEKIKVRLEASGKVIKTLNLMAC